MAPTASEMHIFVRLVHLLLTYFFTDDPKCGSHCRSTATAAVTAAAVAAAATPAAAAAGAAIATAAADAVAAAATATAAAAVAAAACTNRGNRNPSRTKRVVFFFFRPRFSSGHRFVRFANMLINDSIYHMDEAVKFLSAIKAAQVIIVHVCVTAKGLGLLSIDLDNCLTNEKTPAFYGVMCVVKPLFVRRSRVFLHHSLASLNHKPPIRDQRGACFSTKFHAPPFGGGFLVRYCCPFCLCFFPVPVLGGIRLLGSELSSL